MNAEYGDLLMGVWQRRNRMTGQVLLDLYKTWHYYAANLPKASGFFGSGQVSAIK
ncbi:MAG: hypothetical protein AAFN43_04340 [Pseudomonadota bacterium]